MTTLARRQLTVAAVTAAAILATLAAGCNRGPQIDPLDASKARDVLTTALGSWKKGDAVTALQAGSPPVYVIDPDWEAGAKLVNYQVLGDGEEKDAQLFAKVRLTLRNPGGADVTREVTFMVSTFPNVTVSRKIF